MKKLLLLIGILVCYVDMVSSQTHELNQQKYWIYKNRLKSRFMYVDFFDPYVAGSCIPASKRKFDTNKNKNYIEFGDATIYFANYLQVLATEYALLSSYNLPVDNTLRDLFFAIEAMVRLDRNAEYHFRESGSTPTDADINGFFIRDDVDLNYLYNYWWYFDDLYYTDDIWSDFIAHQKFDENPANGGQYAMEMSKDQCWHLYLGFALISKLLDGVEVCNNGSCYNFADRIRLITHSIQYQLSGRDIASHDWELYNPADGHEVPEDRGGKVRPWSYGFGIAGSEIVHYNLHARHSVSDYWRRIFLTIWQWNNLDADDLPERILSTVGDVRDLNDFKRLFEESDLKNIFSYPHLPLIHLILFPQLYSYQDRILANSMLEELRIHLDEAPIEGTSYDAPRYWSSCNCCVWPERRNGGQPGDEYNGLDYMLLHNLYYLAKKEILDLNTVTFPITVHRSYGTFEQPVTIAGNNLVYSHIIPTNTSVSLISGNYVKLQPGFSAGIGGGSFFRASVDDYTFNQASNLKSTLTFPDHYLNLPDTSGYQLIKDFLEVTYKSAVATNIHHNKPNLPNMFVFPNPCKDEIYISLSINNIRIVEFYNTTGNLNKIYRSNASNSHLTINISDLSSGIYFLKIYDEQDNVFNSKIVKQ